MTGARFQGGCVQAPALGREQPAEHPWLCSRAVPGADLADLHARSTWAAPALATYSSSARSRLPKNPVDEHVSYAPVIFKAHLIARYLKIKTMQHRLLQIFPYLIDPDKKAMLGLNLFILHNHMTVQGTLTFVK